jgi:hypothetical protein
VLIVYLYWVLLLIRRFADGSVYKVKCNTIFGWVLG